MKPVEDLAWMAGFVDGEGCLTISRQIRKDRPSPSYRASITITNTKKSALDIFETYYGGNVYDVMENRTDKRKVKWANAYCWYCTVGRAKEFLEDILPYLRIKNDQARIILEFINTKNGFLRKKRLNKRGGSSPLSCDEINHREGLRLAVQGLNSKGQYARQIT